MFKYSAFIKKNNLELRNKLEELGYKDKDMYGYGNTFDSDCLATNGNISEYDECDFDQINFDTVNDRIDCITNEEAFLAIVAIRDDSDYKQLFIWDNTTQTDDSFIKSPSRILGHSEGDWFINNTVAFIDTKECHKATPQEILEIFKNK